MSRFSSLLKARGGGLVRSLSSLSIKVAAAGLTYLTYVVLSRLMGDDAYGQFALGLSLATMLAILAGVGQQTAILRYWPEETGAGRPEKARVALRAGQALTLGAGLTVTVAMLIGGWVSGLLYVAAAALLVLPMAQAEFSSSALRAQGSVWTALAPRDIVWRLALVVAAGLLFVSGVHLSGPGALLLAAGLLAAALVAQWVLAWRRYELGVGTGGVRPYLAEHGKSSRWFLGGAILDSVSINMDTVIVGLMVTQVAAGIYFNAFRTAGLMTLFLFANALVIAPTLSQFFHGGERGEAQRVLTASAWGGFAFSVLIFVIFLVAGRQVLSLFGTGYEEGYLVLILLGIGLLFDAATGPARTAMMMTGHERSYVLLFGATTAIGVALTLAIVPFFGLIGAAAVNAGTRAVSRIVISWWCIRRIGLDPTILGALRLARLDGHRSAGVETS